MGRKYPKAPSGCFWRGATLYGRTRIKGRLVVWSLHTSDPKVAAERRKAGKDRMIADVHHGDARRDFVEVLDLWAAWITKQVGPRTAQRYACSLDQMRPWLDGKALRDVDNRLVGEVIRARTAAGVTNATIKRDLVALSSVLNFAIDQGWRDDNPVLPRMRRVKERRDPIVLPNPIHVDLLIARCPGMVADLVKAAIATGARQDELLKARRDQIDHDRRQLTLLGKGNKVRVIDLDPYSGYRLLQGLPVFARKPLLFWHSEGEGYKNFASQFAAVVVRAAAWAKANGIDFRPFRFHDLRHLHAVTWLKDGRSIYDLQARLGHTSIKTTEMYLRYLTPTRGADRQGHRTGRSAHRADAQGDRRRRCGITKSMTTMRTEYGTEFYMSLKDRGNSARRGLASERLSKPPPSATRPPLRSRETRIRRGFQRQGYGRI